MCLTWRKDSGERGLNTEAQKRRLERLRSKCLLKGNLGGEWRLVMMFDGGIELIELGTTICCGPAVTGDE